MLSHYSITQLSCLGVQHSWANSGWLESVQKLSMSGNDGATPS